MLIQCSKPFGKGRRGIQTNLLGAPLHARTLRAWQAGTLLADVFTSCECLREVAGGGGRAAGWQHVFSIHVEYLNPVAGSLGALGARLSVAFVCWEMPARICLSVCLSDCLTVAASDL